MKYSREVDLVVVQDSMREKLLRIVNNFKIYKVSSYTGFSEADRF